MSDDLATVRARISERTDALRTALTAHLTDGGRLCVIKAPPGSGKTHTLLEALMTLLALDARVAVATQTNAQAEDLCRRLVRDHPGTEVWRWASQKMVAPPDLPAGIHWGNDVDDLPPESGVVVATTAKWAIRKGKAADLAPFDVLLVDEAWQMAWAELMLLAPVAGRFVLIGDPGQIPPVVTIPTARWETAPRPPHRAAPDVILSDPGLGALVLGLPSCRRLPCDSVDLVRPFYDFPFDAWAEPGARWLRAAAGPSQDPLDSVIDHLASASVAIATLPTPPEGPPLEHDAEVAALAAALAVRVLERGATACSGDDGAGEPLGATGIGIAATHRVMNQAILAALPAHLRGGHDGVRVDTPERWQGLQRPFMIVVHPLSGVVRPSTFDLETGRLCVMASRHRAAMVVVSRDHVPETLEAFIPSAEQSIGRPDLAGRGHAQHQMFWGAVSDRGGVFHLG